MNSTRIYNRLLESTSAIQRRFGLAPLPDPTLQAFFAAFTWQMGFLGVDTGDKASVLTGVPRATVDNARIVLASGDVALIDAVLAKTMSLRQASLAVRKGLKLVATYVNSSLADKANLGRAVGPDKVFDEVVVPALGPTIDPVVTIPPITTSEAPTPKPNGKATNGNGSHLYRRPGAPPVIVTH